MNQYTWNISQLDCKAQEDGKTNIVVTAHWTASATDGIYTSTAYGAQSFIYDATKAFTPFASLTLDQVVSWVQEGMGVDAVTALQENLDKRIADQKVPPTVSPTLPWIPLDEPAV